MTGTDQPALSAFLMQARPRSAAEALRLYKPYYEDLLRCNFTNRDFIEQRDAPDTSSVGWSRWIAAAFSTP